MESGYIQNGISGALSRVQSKDRGTGFLFPVKAMSKVYRAIYLTAVRDAWLAGGLEIPPAIKAGQINPLSW